MGDPNNPCTRSPCEALVLENRRGRTNINACCVWKRTLPKRHEAQQSLFSFRQTSSFNRPWLRSIPHGLQPETCVAYTYAVERLMQGHAIDVIQHWNKSWTNMRCMLEWRDIAVFSACLLVSETRQRKILRGLAVNMYDPESLFSWQLQTRGVFFFYTRSASAAAAAARKTQAPSWLSVAEKECERVVVRHPNISLDNAATTSQTGQVQSRDSSKDSRANASEFARDF